MRKDMGNWIKSHWTEDHGSWTKETSLNGLNNGEWSQRMDKWTGR